METVTLRDLARIVWQHVAHTLIITGMAEKTIHVCDICGAEAHAKRQIDVCTKHSVSGTLKSTGRAKPTAAMTNCPVCGKPVKAGAGLAIHTARQHKTQQRKKASAARKKAAARKPASAPSEPR